LKNATMFESLWFVFYIQVAKLFERPSYLDDGTLPQTTFYLPQTNSTSIIAIKKVTENKVHNVC